MTITTKLKVLRTARGLSSARNSRKSRNAKYGLYTSRKW